jgi:hypothetical protein
MMQILEHTPTYHLFKAELNELLERVLLNELTKEDFDKRTKELEEKYEEAFLSELDSRYHVKH